MSSLIQQESCIRVFKTTDDWMPFRTEHGPQLCMYNFDKPDPFL